ncbi:MAG: hypothetical protein HY532_09375 [Chloroflexi bacterium]|nr:hypothetical protein [Chloroflexota bacterium]
MFWGHWPHELEERAQSRMERNRRLRESVEAEVIASGPGEYLLWPVLGLVGCVGAIVAALVLGLYGFVVPAIIIGIAGVIFLPNPYVLGRILRRRAIARKPLMPPPQGGAAAIKPEWKER